MKFKTKQKKIKKQKKKNTKRMAEQPFDKDIRDVIIPAETLPAWTKEN